MVAASGPRSRAHAHAVSAAPPRPPPPRDDDATAHSELATQIQKVILALGDYMSVQCHACIGGTSINEDIKKLEYGQHVVSGTPGRYAWSDAHPNPTAR